MIFDVNDLGTYDKTLKLLLYKTPFIKSLIDDNELKVNINNSIEITTREQFDSVFFNFDLIRYPKKIGYLCDYEFYFDLKLKKFIVKDPITNKKFCVQMTELIEE